MKILNCDYCGKIYKTYNVVYKTHFCSRNCYKKYHKEKNLKECPICNKMFKFYDYQEEIGKGKYCSKECSALSQVKEIELTCNGCGNKFSRKRYARKYSRAYCSHECFLKYDSEFLNMKKEKHPNWKGGIGKVIRKKDNKDILFRKMILKRDNFKCIKCGSKTRLEVDHIWSWSIWKNLRYEEWNCRTLCHECHKKTFNYGYRNHKFLEFLYKFSNVDKDTPTIDEILETRRKLQEQHPELRAVKEVEEQRNLNAIKMQAWSLRDKQDVLF